MAFSEHLLAWRRHQNLTQSQLALRSGIPQPNIAAFEAGRVDPQLSSLRRLSVALDIPLGKFLDERPPQRSWNRHQIDALVQRAMTSSPDKKLDPLAARLQIVASEKLAAAGHPISKRGRTGERLLKQLKAELGPALWDAIVKRLDKHL